LSVRASTWAWEQIRALKLAKGEALVLLRIADHADSEGLCWPGVDGLAEYCGDESTVRRALKGLERRELLERSPRQQAEGRGRASDLIQLHLPRRADQPGDLPGETGPPARPSREPALEAEPDDQPGISDDQPGDLPGETGHDQPGISARPTGQNHHDQPGIPPTPTDIRNRKEPSEEPCHPSPSARVDAPVFVHQLCDLFVQLVNERTNRKKPYVVLDDWLVEMERLVRIDGRSPEEIERAIRWVHAHPFWAANVLSVPKLREQFDTLRLQAERDRTSGRRIAEPSGSSAAARLQARVDRQRAAA
jgi:hypothetical protein